jgi:membrane protease subunit HflK
VTRQRLYIETLEEVLSNSTKVLMDTDGTGNNMIYLPLDRLMERRGSESSPTSYAAPSGTQPSSSNSDSLARLRARESR